jgi:hypothetical protein
MSRLYVAVLACALVAHANAQPRQPAVIAGPGAASCGLYIEGRSLPSPEKINDMTVLWVQGFLSGMNTYRASSQHGSMVLLPDPPSLLAYMDKYCRENPLKSVVQGASAMYAELL